MSGPALYFILSSTALVFEEQAVKLGSPLTKWFARKQGYFCKQWESPVVESLFMREGTKMVLFDQKIPKIIPKVLHSDGDATSDSRDLPWHEVKNYTLKSQGVKASQLLTQDATRNKVLKESKDQILNC